MCWLSSCTTRTCPLLLCVPTPGRLQPHHSHKHSCYTWCAPAQVARNCQPQSKNWWDRCAWVLARAAMNSQGGCNQARPSPVQLLTLMRRVAQLSCFCVQGCQQCVLGSTTSSLDRSAALAQQCSYSSHATAQYNGMLYLVDASVLPLLHHCCVCFPEVRSSGQAMGLRAWFAATYPLCGRDRLHKVAGALGTSIGIHCLSAAATY
jgi:hypothetical protein